MRITLTLFAAFILATFLSCTAPSKSCVAASGPPVSADYILALSTANDFLHAWCYRDQENGLRLLSPALRKVVPEEELRMTISGASNPHHQAFEITGGKALTKDRYSFDVLLYHHYTGFSYPESPPAATIQVVRTGPDTWRIDRFPTQDAQ
jgi:hypothetical protein